MFVFATIFVDPRLAIAARHVAAPRVLSRRNGEKLSVRRTVSRWIEMGRETRAFDSISLPTRTSRVSRDICVLSFASLSAPIQVGQMTIEDRNLLSVRATSKDWPYTVQ